MAEPDSSKLSGSGFGTHTQVRRFCQTIKTITIMKKNEMAKTQAEVGATESAMELTFAAMNKAFGSVFQETMKFKQALRIFDGMAALKVPVSKTKSMRFDEILRMVGVEYKSGRIDANSVMAAWKVRTEDNYMAIYKNVAGMEDVEGEEQKPRKVYTWNEEKKDHMAVSVVKIVAVEKWNARLILRGLLQTAFTERYEKLAKDSQEAWEKYEGELYVFDKLQDKGSVTNKKKVIRKTQVVF